MKRFLIICIAFCAAINALNAGIRIVSYDKLNKTAAVGGTEHDGISDLIIPETVEIDGTTYTVTEIADEGFSGTHYRNITIPNTVKVIGEQAFYYSGVRHITFGTNVEIIYAYPFQGCKALESVTFLSELPPYTGAVNINANGSFTSTLPLKIIIDKQNILNYACEKAYRVNTELYTMTSDQRLETMYDEKYEYLVCHETKQCIISKLLDRSHKEKDLIVPGVANLKFGLASEDYQIVGIGPYAFYATDIDLAIRHVRDEYNDNLSGSVTFNENIKYIGYYAFDHCRLIDEVSLPESLVCIGMNAFCFTGITKVHFGNHLKRISHGAFNDCDLAELSLPKSLENILGFAFSSNKLETIEFNENLKSIGNNAFSYNWNLKELRLPNSLELIDEGAFMNCKGLIDLTLNDGLKLIGAKAFSGLNLEEVTVPPTVQAIGSMAFFNSNVKCMFFMDSTIPISLAEDIMECDKIEYLYIGRDYSMPLSTFKNLNTLEIGNLVATIPDGCFKNSSRLTTVTFGSGIINLGVEAFKYCSISNLILPSSLKTIGESCFAGNRIAYLTIGCGIENIGDYAFQYNPIAVLNITAKNPPVIKTNVFTDYSGRLYTDPRYSEPYKKNDCVWSNFKQFELVPAEGIEVDGPEFGRKKGDQVMLSATISPTDATLSTVLWSSTNPDIAIVNTKGIVTMVNDIDDDWPSSSACSILAYTLYEDSPIAKYNICGGDDSGIVGIIQDSTNIQDGCHTLEIYTLNGIRIAGNVSDLSKGFYILKQGSKISKIAIK